MRTCTDEISSKLAKAQGIYKKFSLDHIDIKFFEADLKGAQNFINGPGTALRYISYKFSSGSIKKLLSFLWGI